MQPCRPTANAVFIYLPPALNCLICHLSSVLIIIALNKVSEFIPLILMVTKYDALSLETESTSNLKDCNCPNLSETTGDLYRESTTSPPTSGTSGNKTFASNFITNSPDNTNPNIFNTFLIIIPTNRSPINLPTWLTPSKAISKTHHLPPLSKQPSGVPLRPFLFISSTSDNYP